jgi:hypothetical protein
MNGATVATMVNILQQNYLPGIIQQFNADFPNLRFIRQNSEDITAEGEKAVIAIQTGLNEGGGFHGESADVPESGYPIVKRVEVTLKQYSHRARLTYRLMRKARTAAHAFARGMQLQMTSTREAFTLNANMYLWGDGTGCVCRVLTEDVAGSRTMVFNRKYGLTSGGSPETLIRPGQVIHILDTLGYTGGVSADRGRGIVETADDSVDGQLTVKVRTGHTLASVAAGDYVYLQNTITGWTDPGESEDNRPAMGLLGMYDADLVPTLQGLSAASEPQWNATKITINEASAVRDLRKMKNRLAKRVRNGKIKYVISTYETHERYAKTLDDKVEFRNVRSLDAMWDVATFEGRPWFLDHTAPDGRLFAVPSGEFVQRYAVTDFIEMIADSGGGPLNLVPNKTVFDMILSAIYEYGCKRRNVLVSGVGITWSV